MPAVNGRGGNSDEAVPGRDVDRAVVVMIWGFGCGEGILEANRRRASS